MFPRNDSAGILGKGVYEGMCARGARAYAPGRREVVDAACACPPIATATGTGTATGTATGAYDARTTRTSLSRRPNNGYYSRSLEVFWTCLLVFFCVNTISIVGLGHPAITSFSIISNSIAIVVFAH